MMLTTFNSLNGINSAAADEATFKLNGTVEFDNLETMHASTTVVSGDAPMPAPMQIGSWWAEKFSRLFSNPREIPKVKHVEVVVEMQAERRITTVESAWLDNSEVAPGGELTGKVALRPWRGERVLREFRVKVPEGIARGEHRLLLSDSDTLNRSQLMAGLSNRTLDLSQTVSLINQERSNDRLYVSLVDPRPTVYADDRALADVPTSVLNVMQSARTGRPMAATAETAHLVESIPLDQVVSGNAALRFTVK